MKRFALFVFILLSVTGVLLAAFVRTDMPDTADTSVAADFYSTVPVAGKWNGKETDLGVYDRETGIFTLQISGTTVAFKFGYPRAGWLPVAGDWDGDGIYTIGLYDQSESTFYLRNSNSAGPADSTVAFGRIAENRQVLPVVGNWNGGTKSEVGIYDQASGLAVLNSQGREIEFTIKQSGVDYLPLTGDWDSDGTSTLGFYNPATAKFLLLATNTTDSVSTEFDYTNSGSKLYPVAGDWDNNGTITVGLYNQVNTQFALRNSNTTGLADITVPFVPSPNAN